MARVVPVGVDGPVDGDDVIVTDRYLGDASVCSCTVPARLKCALVED